MEIKLPTGKVPAAHKSPKNLIIFSKPKAGKTTLLSQLDNCLILDLENGSDYVDAMKVKATSLAEIKQIGAAIKDAGNPYQYVAVDTITALEEMCIPYAEELYARSPMGKNWLTEGKSKHGSLLNLPNGAGYPWLREAFVKVIDYIKTWAPRTGKLKLIATSNSDAIGYLFRKGNKNILSFKTTDEIACGARPEHLRNKEIEVSELVDDTVVVNWDKIFID
jgi:energy-coupling factor transporter ATP-binding protein EcfA2